MAAGVEYKRRARRGRRRRGKKGALSPAQKSQVKGIIESTTQKTVELKTFDTVLNETLTISFTSGQSVDLCLVAQGDGQSQRDGAHIQPVSLFLRFGINVPDAYNNIRIIIWRQALSTATVAAALTTILEYTTGATIDREIFTPYKVHTEITTFKVLYDKNFILTSGTNTHDMIQELFFDLRKFSQIEYADGVNTGQNHFILSYVSDSVATHPTLKGYARLRYRDQ